MILVDRDIIRYCRGGMITPFDERLVNAASIDIRIGTTLKLESYQRLWPPRLPLFYDYDLSQHNEENPYWLPPARFCLAGSLEVFDIPTCVASEFRLKSSRAREAYDNALAVWLDPGWHGSVLTMELKNNSQYGHLPLYPGLLIGQLFFHECTGEPERPYGVTGRYNGDTTVMESKG